MPTLKNVSDRVVLVRLNSGKEVILAPGKELTVPDSEVRSNPVVENLRRLELLRPPPEKAQGKEPQAKEPEAKEPEAHEKAGEKPKGKRG